MSGNSEPAGLGQGLETCISKDPPSKVVDNPFLLLHSHTARARRKRSVRQPHLSAASQGQSVDPRLKLKAEKMDFPLSQPKLSCNLDLQEMVG